MKWCILLLAGCASECIPPPEPPKPYVDESIEYQCDKKQAWVLVCKPIKNERIAKHE